jgi:hypothetical protein
LRKAARHHYPASLLDPLRNFLHCLKSTIHSTAAS